MRLSRFLVVLIVIALCSPAEAQQAKRIPRVGFLSPGASPQTDFRYQAFQQGLRELGYIEGKSITVEYRGTDGKADRFKQLAAELVHRNVDVIVTATPNAIDATKTATKTIPVVFTAAIDPVGDGQVASLARPGGNLTGLSILAPELNGKRLELVKDAFPNVTRIAFLTRTGGRENRFNEAELAAKALGLRLQFFAAKGADDLDRTFDAAKSAGVQAFIFPPTTFLIANRARTIELASKSRLPAVYPGGNYAESGGLMSYGPDSVDNYRRAASYVDKILKGAKPSDLPVEQPMKFEFIINLKTAKEIGLTIPPNVLLRADRVIK